MAINIRPELPADAAAIRGVTSAAFEFAPHSGGNEADIVEAQRAPGALTLALVAVHSEQVVGHVAFSPVEVSGSVKAWLGLGPVSVSPDFQRMGVVQGCGGLVFWRHSDVTPPEDAEA